ncbi:Aminodeoxychorismate/anthranilate synthase component 2 [Candidatus Magnetomoraceae bacterium gMMP-15]
MILLLDNYDSFTYNIFYALESLGQKIKVVRSDTLSPDDVGNMSPQAIVISPGPGRPEDAGISCKVIDKFAGKIPILGVCLGHQCIGQVFGAKVIRADVPVHGKTSDIIHNGKGIYSNIDNPFRATRYHSLIVSHDTVSKPLEIVAHTSNNIVMGLRCENLKIEGVQFHPESIATKQGGMIFKNFIEKYICKNSN